MVSFILTHDTIKVNCHMVSDSIWQICGTMTLKLPNILIDITGKGLQYGEYVLVVLKHFVMISVPFMERNIYSDGSHSLCVYEKEGDMYGSDR